MKIITAICILFFTCSTSKYVQGQIIGKITDYNGNPLSGIAVLLLQSSDSTSIADHITDDKGNFSFRNINKGIYFITTVTIGNITHSDTFEYNGTKVYLPTIKLPEVVHSLKEVSITATIPQLEQKSDRLIVNVAKMNTAGDNALDIIKKAPGVRLDKDENIMLKGNSGVNVMINGRSTYMSKNEISNYLKTLPGDVISKIEIMANPPANYDAEGTAGIINIILKRNRSLGYAGSFSTNIGYGRYGKFNTSGILNYNSGKLSLYTRFSYLYGNSYNQLTLHRQIDDALYHQVNYWHPVSNAITYTIGADYYLNSRNTLGILFKKYGVKENAVLNTTSETIATNNSKHQEVNASNDHNTNNQIYNIGANYLFTIDSAGKKISLDIAYANNRTQEHRYFLNSYTSTNNSIDIYKLRSNNPVNYSISSIKTDYTHPITNKNFVEIGYKSSWVSTDNNAQFDSLKTAGWKVDSLRSGHFRYDENINAVYITVNTILKKWDLKANIRAEQTVSSANSITGNQIRKRNYVTFFPGVFATYKPNTNHSLHASYSSRIGRQNYIHLNPFYKYHDPYTAFAGNPYLTPSRSNSFTVSYNFKNYQILGLSYIIARNAISRVIYQNDQTKESINKNENLDRSGSFIASSTGSFNIKKWWSVNLDINISYDFVNASVQSIDYQSGQAAYLGSIDQSFIFLNNTKLLLSFQYCSSSVFGLEQALPASQVDIGISKAFLNDKIALSLKARDIFFGDRYRSILRYNNINTRWENEYESRRFSLNISYRFGDSKYRRVRRFTNPTETEENRIQ